MEKKYDYTNEGFACQDFDTACCCWTQAMNEKKNVSIDHYMDMYLIKEQKIDRIFSDNTSINRFVISQTILKLLFLIRECHGDKSELIAYNTDGIYIKNPKINFKNKKDIKFETNHIGQAFKTDDKVKYFEKRYREKMNFEDYKDMIGDGCIYYGQAGSGKSTKLIEMVKT